jgi:large subunit ribosomal protein L20
MVRVTAGPPSRRRKNRFFKQAKGYWGGRSRLWRTVRESVERGWAYSTRDRRARKRDFRGLWIIRINAAARMRGVSYSALIDGLKKAQVGLDRKALAALAAHDPAAFDALVEKAKSARS